MSTSYQNPRFPLRLVDGRRLERRYATYCFPVERFVITPVARAYCRATSTR